MKSIVVAAYKLEVIKCMAESALADARRTAPPEWWERNRTELYLELDRLRSENVRLKRRLERNTATYTP
jgi:hypothetical protein